jgi:hypothetical protein
MELQDNRDGHPIWEAEIPDRILKAAKDIEIWTKMNGWRNWQMLGIESRGYKEINL